MYTIIARRKKTNVFESKTYYVSLEGKVKENNDYKERGKVKVTFTIEKNKIKKYHIHKNMQSFDAR